MSLQTNNDLIDCFRVMSSSGAYQLLAKALKSQVLREEASLNDMAAAALLDDNLRSAALVQYGRCRMLVELCDTVDDFLKER